MLSFFVRNSPMPKRTIKGKKDKGKVQKKYVTSFPVFLLLYRVVLSCRSLCMGGVPVSSGELW